MGNHRPPATALERRKLERNVAITGFGVYLLIALIVAVGFNRYVHVSHPKLAMVVPAAVAVLLLAWLIYISFFLRCPRCAGWMSVRPKCITCGLRLEQGPTQE